MSNVAKRQDQRECARSTWCEPHIPWPPGNMGYAVCGGEEFPEGVPSPKRTQKWWVTAEVKIDPKGQIHPSAGVCIDCLGWDLHLGLARITFMVDLHILLAQCDDRWFFVLKLSVFLNVLWLIFVYLLFIAHSEWGCSHMWETLAGTGPCWIFLLASKDPRESKSYDAVFGDQSLPACLM